MPCLAPHIGYGLLFSAEKWALSTVPSRVPQDLRLWTFRAVYDIAVRMGSPSRMYTSKNRSINEKGACEDSGVEGPGPSRVSRVH